MGEVCRHCDVPNGVTVAVTIVGQDRKIYDVEVCTVCHEALRRATPMDPSARGWHGIMEPARMDLP